jgi:transposase
MILYDILYIIAYNKQYRTRVVEYVLEGHTQVEASSAFKVCFTSINRWLASYKASGSTGGGYTVGGRGHKKIDPGELKAYMDEYPDALLKEVAQEFSCCIEAARKQQNRFLAALFAGSQPHRKNMGQHEIVPA